MVDTRALGIGMGSSRTSSWLVASLAQFGFLGFGLLLVLVGILLRGLGGVDPRSISERDYCVTRAARAAALTSLIGASVASASADPGLLFFISLAILDSTRARATSLNRSYSLPSAEAAR